VKQPHCTAHAAQSAPRALISNSIFGLARHAILAATYLGLAYAAKLAFGVSLTFTAMR
jgi:hypothetical protein